MSCAPAPGAAPGSDHDVRGPSPLRRDEALAPVGLEVALVAALPGRDRGAAARAGDCLASRYLRLDLDRAGAGRAVVERHTRLLPASRRSSRRRSLTEA